MERLKFRRDFLAAARGRKISRRAFTLQARDRGDDGPARIGFTVTRRTAKKAVERNRIRRRLKEGCRDVDNAHYRTGTDYVVVGRRPALTIPYGELKAELVTALRALNNRNKDEAAGQERPRSADGQ